MRRFLATLACASLCAVLGLGTTGCGKKKEKTTTTAATTAPTTTTTTGPGQDAAKVTLAADPIEIELKDKKGQGKAKITATRKNADDEIALKFSDVEGLEFKDGTIAKGKTEAMVEVIANDKAKPGEYTVDVTGTAGKATVEGAKLKITLKGKAVAEVKKGSVTLAAESLEVLLKEKKGAGKLKVTATRKDADDEITLDIGKIEGVEFKGASIPKGKTEAMVDVTVTDKAKAGDYEITISGTTSGMATVTAAKTKITIK